MYVGNDPMYVCNEHSLDRNFPMYIENHPMYDRNYQTFDSNGHICETRR